MTSDGSIDVCNIKRSIDYLHPWQYFMRPKNWIQNYKFWRSGIFPGVYLLNSHFICLWKAPIKCVSLSRLMQWITLHFHLAKRYMVYSLYCLELCFVRVILKGDYSHQSASPLSWMSSKSQFYTSKWAIRYSFDKLKKQVFSNGFNHTAELLERTLVVPFNFSFNGATQFFDWQIWSVSCWFVYS